MRLRHPLAALLAAMLSACASPPPAIPEATVLIYGEQHDQPDHQRQVATDVSRLARDGLLGAIVIEMAERGHSTAGLPRGSDPAKVREALAWSGWEWPAYEPVVMAGVRAGVPVLGGNLPRVRMREAMRDEAVDATVPATARERIATAVREGHCGALPPSQEPGMVRIQLARDASMAETLAKAAADHPGRRIVLLTGAQHAARDQGVPMHLPSGLSVHVTIFGEPSIGLAADGYRSAAVKSRTDPCIGLKERLSKPPSAPAG